MFILGFLALMIGSIVCIEARYGADLNITSSMGLASTNSLLLWGGILMAVLAVFVLFYGATMGRHSRV